MGFTIEAVEELAALHGEPEWVRARRREAFATYERLPMPSRSEEEWRRTDIRGLDLGAFEAFERANGSAPADPIEDAAG
ncbi:MAG TPA: Fe-S cluster assembly protein SufD, partial [Methylomirabilota bacterium]|nr:Fe-S cluster assembly protein SufD [Methylomirabilota bacterium]